MAQATPMFRLFISSTFNDLKAERNTLQERVWPQLRELCARRGARFQAVDLRWGVSQEASLDQLTMEICLDEIARCRRVSPRPNFLVLLGDRYGSRFLPVRIPAAEFERLCEHLAKEDIRRLEEWYWRDDNAVPAEYRLQPRTLPDDTGDVKEPEEAREAERKAWERTERELRSLLLVGLQHLPPGSYDPAPYLASATEQEILAGVLNVADAAGHVHCFFRTIEGLPGDARAAEFLALDAEGRPDAEARSRLDDLKRRLRVHLPGGNIHEYRARWTGDGSGITTDHLALLCEDVYAALAGIIEAELARQEAQRAVDQEEQGHAEFGAERRRHFQGREQIRQSIAAYLAGGDRHPLLIYGAAGVGKSALMAQASAEALARHEGAEVLVRFIGATPESADARTLLQGLCQQVSHRYGADASTIPTDYEGLVQEFPNRLGLATTQMPLVLFLDALDQLGETSTGGGQRTAATPAMATLNWLPIDLPEHVHLVATILSDLSDAEEGLVPFGHRLPAENLLVLEGLSREDGGEVLDRWLAEAQPPRRFKPAQREALLNAFARHGLPLYLRLAFEEARRWTSYTPEAKTLLDPEIPGIIRQLFTRLSDPANHGPLLVGHGLGYLAAGRNGLSEDEVVDVLSEDTSVMADLLQRASKASPAVTRLPVVLWSRLYFDLEPYLTERATDGARTLAFYHQQLAQAVAEAYLTGAAGIERHRGLARYFAWPEDGEEVDSTEAAPNLRTLAELPYQQTLGELWDDLFATLTNFRFLEQKTIHLGVVERTDAQGQVAKTYTGVYLLQNDYSLALQRLPVQ